MAKATPIERRKHPSKQTIQQRLPAVNEIPEPVRPLFTHGMAMWERLWASGAEWISDVTDIELVQIICETVDERSALRQVVVTKGEWRQRAALRQLDSFIMLGLANLGFTPVERARVGFAAVDDPEPVGKLAQLRAVVDDRRQ